MINFNNEINEEVKKDGPKKVFLKDKNSRQFFR